VFEDEQNIDAIIAPVGGGGLLSGTAIASHYFSPHTTVIAAEPEGAADTFTSFSKKTFVPSHKPNTIADGLLTSLGTYTFPIILKHVDQVWTVSDAEIVEAMKWIMQYLKIVVEPSSAVTLALVKKHKSYFEGKKIVLILSGGNVDMNQLGKLLSHESR
jgi:threonine dehydratase